MADLLKDFSVSASGLALFFVISLLYGFGQYFIASDSLESDL
jgi:hypothetical protein